MRISSLVIISALGLTAACEKQPNAGEPSQPEVSPSKTRPAAADQEDVTIETVKVADNLHMLVGKGGNIGVHTGVDGILMIDDQFAPLAPKIEAAIAELKTGPISYVVNTHHHGDHTGGNPIFGKDATIVAHDNVRKHLVAEAKPAAGYPVLTFDQSVTFHFNGDTIRVVHFANGHTDGDSVIFFDRAKAVHTGDHFFNGRFPYIDLKAGGDPVKLLANVDRLIEMIAPDTKIIPGHGPLATFDDLRRYRAMLDESIETVRKQIAAGKTLAQIQKAGLPATYKSWGTAFIDQNRWLEILHTALTAK